MNVGVLEILIVQVFISALFIICGLGVTGDRLPPDSDLPPYTATVYCMALLFAIFAGAICVLDIVQGGSASAVQDNSKGQPLSHK